MPVVLGWIVIPWVSRTAARLISSALGRDYTSSRIDPIEPLNPSCADAVDPGSSTLSVDHPRLKPNEPELERKDGVVGRELQLHPSTESAREEPDLRSRIWTEITSAWTLTRITVGSVGRTVFTTSRRIVGFLGHVRTNVATFFSVARRFIVDYLGQELVMNFLITLLRGLFRTLRLLFSPIPGFIRHIWWFYVIVPLETFLNFSAVAAERPLLSSIVIFVSVLMAIDRRASITALRNIITRLLTMCLLKLPPDVSRMVQSFNFPYSSTINHPKQLLHLAVVVFTPTLPHILLRRTEHRIFRVHRWMITQALPEAVNIIEAYNETFDNIHI